MDSQCAKIGSDPSNLNQDVGQYAILPWGYVTPKTISTALLALDRVYADMSHHMERSVKDQWEVLYDDKTPFLVTLYKLFIVKMVDLVEDL